MLKLGLSQGFHFLVVWFRFIRQIIESGYQCEGIKVEKFEFDIDLPIIRKLSHLKMNCGSRYQILRNAILVSFDRF